MNTRKSVTRWARIAPVAIGTGVILMGCTHHRPRPPHPGGTKPATTAKPTVTTKPTATTKPTVTTIKVTTTKAATTTTMSEHGDHDH